MSAIRFDAFVFFGATGAIRDVVVDHLLIRRHRIKRTK